MKVSVFIATSLDGYIARTNGNLDWLPNADAAAHDEDYGYQAFFDSVDAIAMGRNTYELIRTFDVWPYANKRVIVLTNRTLTIPSAMAPQVEARSGNPTVICQQLSTQGVQHLYVDGGKTIQQFLQAGLIDHLTIAQIPVLIGSGIPLFGTLTHDVKLTLVEMRSFPNGVIQSRYTISS